jgi:hypothetical protein
MVQFECELMGNHLPVAKWEHILNVATSLGKEETCTRELLQGDLRTNGTYFLFATNRCQKVRSKPEEQISVRAQQPYW